MHMNESTADRRLAEQQFGVFSRYKLPLRVFLRRRGGLEGAIGDVPWRLSAGTRRAGRRPPPAAAAASGRDHDAAEVGGADAERGAQGLEHLHLGRAERAVGEADARDLLDEGLFALRFETLGEGCEVVTELRRIERVEVVGEPRLVVALGAGLAGGVDRGRRAASLLRSPAASIDTAATRIAPRRFSLNAADVGHVEDLGPVARAARRALHLFAERLADREERDEEEREPAPDLLEHVRAVGAARAQKNSPVDSALVRPGVPKIRIMPTTVLRATS